MMRPPVRLALVTLCVVAILATAGAAGAVHAQEGQAPIDDRPVEGVITRVVEEGQSEALGALQPYQILEVEIRGRARTAGDGGLVQVHNSLSQGGPVGRLAAGDRVWLQPASDLEGRQTYLIISRSRSGALAWGLVALVVLVVLVGQWHGVRALGGLVLSFAVVFGFILPRIAAGASPVGVTLLGLGVTMPISYYLAHGWGRKTTVALAGSLVALVFTAILAENMIASAHLTGRASEEATFLLGMFPGLIDVRSLLLAGMLIAILGVLDDITVAQASVVEQLAAANPAWRPEHLAWRAMLVGRDHIASMANTLVLVYAGAALPLLLLLTNRDLPFAYTVSYELIAEEIVRIVVTSIGLVAAVPVTTVLAARVMGRRQPRAQAAPYE